MTDPAVLGALAGLAIGIADFVALGLVRTPRTGGSGLSLKLVRGMSLVVFPIVGWFAGPIVASSLAG
ncbi:hypothetical protein ASG43_08425 [Aureimonas sp. Leaf454]|uniref:hypothetical protein n=1 Tax=Aureimonas sp. Leaf454 TaxID=1736381 RepID=UPI0006F28FBD|nr:hypothetical protein [Aureimonas sp. Leaf454]KQT48859.1 hypothetical protein ASG43_08425 [Aureimonas sp. Leaf454]